MSVPCQSVPESLPVKDLIVKFKQTGLSVFPVVDEYDTMVGIVAIADILKSFDSHE
jgi:CBS domain containing-hemolysin-like protein